MIELKNASRWYGQVIGINDVTCTVSSGITALLGPNGAGKSTLMKMVTGQLKPTTGSVTVFGERPFANPSVLRRLGYCPENEQLYDDMTGTEFVTMLGAMAGISSERLKSRVGEVIELVGMSHASRRKIGGYSKGMRQRIKIAQGIIHDPKVFILDEPLNGLDPVGRREVGALILSLAAKGVVVLLSSHILHEVESLTSNILLMYRGRLLAQGSIRDIRSHIDKHPHRITIRCADARPLAKKLLDMPYVLSAKFDKMEASEVEVETRAPDQFYSHFPEVVAEGGFLVTGFDSPDNNLESVFKYLVTK